MGRSCPTNAGASKAWFILDQPSLQGCYAACACGLAHRRVVVQRGSGRRRARVACSALEPDCSRRAQLAHLRDLRHPSLRAKKYDESRGLWQARINDDWRFYFTIEGDSYILRGLIPHPR